MQQITAIIRPEKLHEVRNALSNKGYPGISITRIEGHGKQKGLTQQFRGGVYTIELIPKIKIDIVVKDEDVKGLVTAIMDAAKTGATGDGKIFVSPMAQVFRIRTGERDESAL